MGLALDFDRTLAAFHRSLQQSLGNAEVMRMALHTANVTVTRISPLSPPPKHIFVSVSGKHMCKQSLAGWQMKPLFWQQKGNNSPATWQPPTQLHMFTWETSLKSPTPLGGHISPWGLSSMHLFPMNLTAAIQQAKGPYCLILEECLPSSLPLLASWLPELNSSPLVGQCLQKMFADFIPCHFQE